jgi:hypothetical protein
MRLTLDSDHPNMPLEPVQVFTGSAERIFVENISRSNKDVHLELTAPDGSFFKIFGVRSGGNFSALIAANMTAQSGIANAGLKIIGTDETGAELVLGWSDLIVFLPDGTLSPVEGGITRADFQGIEELKASDSAADTKDTVNTILQKLKG